MKQLKTSSLHFIIHVNMSEYIDIGLTLLPKKIRVCIYDRLQVAITIPINYKGIYYLVLLARLCVRARVRAL